MTDKSELINYIKEWIEYDNELKNMQKKSKKIREEKKKITEKLVGFMKENEIDAFDINNGQLKYSKSKTKAPLSKKHLYQSLTTFFSTNTNLAKEAAEFILNTRKEKVKENIKRKISKK